MSGQWKKAEKEFEKALEIEPDAPGAAENLEKVRAQIKANSNTSGGSR
jgi:Tfp pilus assembly protein PilF